VNKFLHFVHTERSWGLQEGRQFVCPLTPATRTHAKFSIGFRNADSVDATELRDFLKNGLAAALRS
jgi:hypothetical protein